VFCCSVDRKISGLMIYFFPKINRIIIILKTDIWKAAKLLLAQLLKLDINEQLSREVDYLKAENQVLKIN